MNDRLVQSFVVATTAAAEVVLRDRMEKLVDKTPSDTERGNCGKYQVAVVHSSGHLTKYISTVHFNNITTHMCEQQGLKTFCCKSQCGVLVIILKAS